MSIVTSIALLILATQSAPVPQQEGPVTKTYLEYRNDAEGITFKAENGRVELTVPAPKRGKSPRQEFVTYHANSPEEFKREYPEVSKKYNLDRFFSRESKPAKVDHWMDLWTNRLDRWFDEEHQVLRDLERRLREDGMPVLAEPSPASPSHFGVRIGAVPEPLRVQLGLAPQEGLMVSDVEKGSLADSSGLKKFDVLLRISGQSIEGTDRFREEMSTALQAKDFILGIVRRGSPLKLTVHPSHT